MREPGLEVEGGEGGEVGADEVGEDCAVGGVGDGAGEEAGVVVCVVGRGVLVGRLGRRGLAVLGGQRSQGNGRGVVDVRASSRVPPASWKYLYSGINALWPSLSAGCALFCCGDGVC